jgi:adenosylmethionine-8-amino-7-oxononanoate aminotransferase
MTLAKGLTSGYAPMSTCLVSDQFYEILKSGSSQLGPFAHGNTYTAHPVSAVAALNILESIARPILNMIAFGPPLVPSTEDAEQIVASFARALTKLADQVEHRRRSRRTRATVRVGCASS